MDTTLAATGLHRVELLMRRNSKQNAESRRKDGYRSTHMSIDCKIPKIVIQLDCLIRYNVPRSWLKVTGNLLVLFEEMGGNPYGISLVKRKVQSVCTDIYEQQPTLTNWQLKSYGKPNAHLTCDDGQKISSIKFASFGKPQGVCGSYWEGTCHAHKSWDAFTEELVRHMKDIQSFMACCST